MMKFRCGQSFAAFGTSDGCPSFGSGVGSGVSPLWTQMLKKPGRVFSISLFFVISS